jgi:flagellar M-ring protein FliF
MADVKNTALNVWNTVKTKWSSTSKNSKVALIACFSVVVVSLVVLTILVNQTGYSVLYSGAGDNEAAEVITYMQTELGLTDIKYTNGDILVPSEKVEQLRIQLSIAGYPRSAFNYDIWDQGVGMFSTQSEIREKQKQQLESNLAATFNTIEGVDRAIVILNIPKDNNYVLSTSKEKSSASVVLHLKNRTKLSSDVIAGLYNIVLTSVPSLERENITITDGTGAPLLESNSDEDNQNTLLNLFYKRLEFENQMKSLLEEDLENMLTGMFKNFAVQVSVQLNYDKEISESTEYTPSVPEEGTQGGMVGEIQEGVVVDGTGPNGGVIGTPTNADIAVDYPTFEISEDGIYYYENQRNIKYKVNEYKKQTEKSGYSVEKITVSVAFDDVNMSLAEQEEWRRFIANAVGTDVENCSVKTQPFLLQSPGAQEPSIPITTADRSTLLILMIVLGGLLILLLFLALMTGSSRRKKTIRAQKALAMAGTAPAPVPVARDERELFEVPVTEDVQSLTESVSSDTREAVLRREIKDFSRTNPEIVAQLIRTWMRKDD